MKKIIALLVSTAMIAACVPQEKKNVYNENEVGKNTVVSFGKVLSFRNVKVEGNSSGIGALAGAGAGGLAGSAIGRGNGSLAGLIAGAVIGGVGGAIAEQKLRDQVGVEYIIRFASLDLTKSIVQTIQKEEAVISVGTCVMVQQSGDYQRVLPATDANLCEAEDDSTTHRSKSMNHKKKKSEKAEDDNDE